MLDKSLITKITDISCLLLYKINYTLSIVDFQKEKKKFSRKKRFIDYGVNSEFLQSACNAKLLQ